MTSSELSTGRPCAERAARDHVGQVNPDRADNYSSERKLGTGRPSNTRAQSDRVDEEVRRNAARLASAGGDAAQSSSTHNHSTDQGRHLGYRNDEAAHRNPRAAQQVVAPTDKAEVIGPAPHQRPAERHG